MSRDVLRSMADIIVKPTFRAFGRELTRDGGTVRIKHGELSFVDLEPEEVREFPGGSIWMDSDGKIYEEYSL